MAFAASISARAAFSSPFFAFATPRPWRARILLLDLERRRVIRDCVVQFSHFQVDQAAAVERVGIGRPYRQRAIAIFNRLFEVTDHGAGPAATVPSANR